ncbi:AfsR/SARP family transcriptional regulator, partial [Nonomuraea sp. NPDC003201]
MVVEQPVFSVLGPLQARVPAGPLRIAGRKPRLLLASLLLEANEVVSSEALVEVLWPRTQPSSAVANLRTYVSTLRSAGVQIEARPAGYVMQLDTGRLDALEFEDLVARARAAGRTEEPAEHLRRALALWRGTPLGDLPASPLWDGRLRALTQARLAAVEELVALKLARGEHAAAIDDLRDLIGEHPYREDLWQQLILALHHSGRRAEALNAYATIRRQLVDELGIEPGQELRDVHASVLAGDAPPAPVAAAPHQLPADVPDFTGRARDVAAVTRALSPEAHRPDGPPAIA